MIMEEFPEPYRSMGRAAVFFRERAFVFLHEDELAYEDVLRKAFPALGYVASLSKEDAIGHAQPKPKQFLTLVGHPQAETLEEIGLHFDAPDASPLLKRDPVASRWYSRMGAWPNAYWQRHAKPVSHALKNYDGRMIERLYVSRLVFRCRRWVKEDLRMATKALRLLDKAGTRNVECVRWPEMDDGKPYGLLHGHHAMAWLRADPDRVSDLRFTSAGALASRPGPEGLD